MVDYRLTPDGVQARLATKEDLAHLEHAEARLGQLRAPLLLETSRDRVFVSAIDGTANNVYKDSQKHHTIVGRLNRDIEALKSPFIASGYVPGIGTQDGFVRSLVDGVFADTFRSRVEHAYYQFCLQARQWIDEDPDVRIHLVGIGFSRGAEQMPALQRLVHERGILDPVDAVATYGPDGILTAINYADRPPLVPPGRTVQVALLHDPVASSVKGEARALPPSNVSALGFTALHEPRGLFDATRHLPDGLSSHGRVANFSVTGRACRCWWWLPPGRHHASHLQHGRRLSRHHVRRSAPAQNAAAERSPSLRHP